MNYNYSNAIIVHVKPKIYAYYPYMDTLYVYAPVKGILSNQVSSYSSTLDYNSYPDLKLDRSFKSIFKDLDSIVFGAFKKKTYKYGTPVFTINSVSGEARPY